MTSGYRNVRCLYQKEIKVHRYILAWLCGPLAIYPDWDDPYRWAILHRPSQYEVFSAPAQEAAGVLLQLARLPWPRTLSEVMAYRRALPLSLIAAASDGRVEQLREEVDAVLGGAE